MKLVAVVSPLYIYHFVFFLGLVKHLVQAKESIYIHTTAFNIRIKKKNRNTTECSCFTIFIPGLDRWFTLLKEILITKGFGYAILKYVIMVF